MRLTISAALLDSIAAAGRANLPREVCGLLIGLRSDDGITVARIAPSANLAAGNDAFEIDPSLLLRLQRELRGTGEALVGLYHSHPFGEARPSPRDLAGANYPGFAWLITAFDADGAAVHAAFWHDSAAGVPPAVLEPMTITVA